MTPKQNTPQFNIDLSIDSILLEGFTLSTAECEQVRLAMQGELTRLLAEVGIPRTLQSSGEAWRLDSGAIAFPERAAPGVIGTQIAGAVYRSLGGETEK